MSTETTLSRDVPLDSDQAALLFIDVQNYCVRRDGGEFAGLPPALIDQKFGYYFDRLERMAIPNMRRLQAAFRKAGAEVLYTTIESLTKDGRERSLDYKISGLNVAKGSWDGRVIDEIAPTDDELWIPKSSSSVFVSTHIDYLLRNLGIRQLVVSGVVTDQCVESAVRDACDLGYLVTLVTDACATYSQDRHDSSLSAIRGYCRQVATETVLNEIRGAGVRV